MPILALESERPHGTRALWSAFWGRVRRPSHHKVVHELKIAAQGRDSQGLTALLDPHVAVVVESDHADQSGVRMVTGIFDAIPLLIHGMATQRGLVVTEGTVSGQAGLFLRRPNETAAVTVDFSGPLIAAVWIRLHQESHI